MKNGETLTVGALIQAVRRGEDAGQRYCVYGSGDSDDASLESACLIAGHPTLTDDDDEICPPLVAERGLELWYRDEVMRDVIANAVHQRTNVSDATVLLALKDYDNRDAFMTIP